MSEPYWPLRACRTRTFLWVNPYLDDIKQYGAMNKVYETYFEFGNTPGQGNDSRKFLARRRAHCFQWDCWKGSFQAESCEAA